LITDL